MGRLQSLAFGVAVATSTALLSACGGGGGGGGAHTSGALPGTGNPPGSVAPQGSATASFALTLQQYTPVNTSARHRRIAYISPATAQISLTVVSVNGVPAAGSPMTFGVSPSSPNCAGANGVVTCNLSATIPIGSDVLSASTLDTNGHSLGTSTITATVQQNATNAIALAIGGQIANLQLYLSQSQFTSGTAGKANVIVVPLDQSGAEIVNPGNYNPAIAVVSSSPVNGHVSLLTDGANTGQNATLNSPNDQLVVNYDGVATAGNTTITASAGPDISQMKNVSVSAQGLFANPNGAQFVTTNSYIFTGVGQTGTIAIGGGTGPYTVVSSDPTLASITGAGPYTITANGYGVAGTATITVSDNLGAHSTIPVTFIAPAIVLAISSCGGSACSPTGMVYTIPLGGPPAGLTASTFTAAGGTGAYTYFFISTGLTTSPYASVLQAGNSFTITPSGFGNDALIVTSGNQIAYFAIAASADAFGQALPRAIGMIYMINQVTGKFYSATLPATTTNANPVPTISGFMFNAIGPTIDATPTTTGNGTFTFNNTFGTSNVPYTVFGLVFGSYPGTGASSSLEQTVPAGAPGADEQFTAVGQTDSVTVSGQIGVLGASSGNAGVVTVSTAGSVVTVTSVGAGTTTITVTDNGTGASASYVVSVTTTTIPVSDIHRHP